VITTYATTKRREEPTLFSRDQHRTNYSLKRVGAAKQGAISRGRRECVAAKKATISGGRKDDMVVAISQGRRENMATAISQGRRKEVAGKISPIVFWFFPILFFILNSSSNSK
jgi:hypothetical protein